MTCLVVGSVALDTVDTPFGRAVEALGGTAVYFSLAASLFADVQLVGVVGEDFPREAVEMLRQRGVDLAGLQVRAGDTFRWVGEYGYDMNVAHTLDTQLNVFETFSPELPESFRQADHVFLGNIDPDLQLSVLEQVTSPALTAVDTMNYWIDGKKDRLLEVVRRVDAVLINEAEIRQLTGHYNVLDAARSVQDLGPECVVIKRGEYGSLMLNGDEICVVPGFPTADVRDTTGAGDSFAGGFIGYLDARGPDADLRAALVYGTILASFTVEDFSVGGLARATVDAVGERYHELADVTRIEAGVVQRMETVSKGVRV